MSSDRTKNPEEEEGIEENMDSEEGDDEEDLDEEEEVEDEEDEEDMDSDEEAKDPSLKEKIAWVDIEVSYGLSCSQSFHKTDFHGVDALQYLVSHFALYR